MKQCTVCKEQKPFDQFYKCARRADGYASGCKKCCNRSHNRSRSRKIEHYREVQKARQNRWAQQFKLWKEQQKCLVCHENDIVCLDLHHLDPSQKDRNVSDAVWRWSHQTLMTEVAKCVVLCASCHRKLHAGRFTIDPATRTVLFPTSGCSSIW